MAYDWPAGWNETRTERAVQQFVCDTLNVPKYACRCAIDNEHHGSTPRIQIFKPLTGKRTADVHEVFGRLVTFADPWLFVDVPEEKVDERTYYTRTITVWEPDETARP